MANECESENYVAEIWRVLMCAGAVPALRSIIGAATYDQRCCMQHLWSHQRRDFIECAAGQVSLTQWCQGWIERIAALYRLNEARLVHYDAELERQTASLRCGAGRAEAGARRPVCGGRTGARRPARPGARGQGVALSGKPSRGAVRLCRPAPGAAWITISLKGCSEDPRSEDGCRSAPTARTVPGSRP